MKRALVALTTAALAAGSLGCSGSRGGGVPRAPQVSPGGPKIPEALGTVGRRAEAMGASPQAIVATGIAADGERVGAFVDVEPGRCVLAYARGSDSIDDLDIAAFADDGRPLAVDQAPDRTPIVLACPKGERRMYVAAQVASGHGAVAVGAHAVPSARALRFARAFRAEGSFGEGAHAPESWPGLDAVVARHTAALGGSWTPTRRVGIDIDAAGESLVPVAEDRAGCLDAVIVADDNVADFEVALRDPRGAVLARAKPLERGKALTVCADEAFAGAFVLRSRIGAGRAIVVMSRHPGRADARADFVWIGTAEPIDRAIARQKAKLRAEGLVVHAGHRVAANTGTVQRVRVGQERGRAACQRFDLVAGHPAAWIDVSSFSATGERIDWRRFDSVAPTFSCDGAPVELAIEARGRGGPLAVLESRLSWPGDRPVKRPHAVARMLGAIFDAGAGELLGRWSEPRALDVAPRGRYVREERVLGGQCLIVAAGAASGSGGFDILLSDAGSSVVLDRAESDSAAFVRACAKDAPRAVRVEIRSVSAALRLEIAQATERLSRAGSLPADAAP